jgi:hypothetical protein
MSYTYTTLDSDFEVTTGEALAAIEEFAEKELTLDILRFTEWEGIYEGIPMEIRRGGDGSSVLLGATSTNSPFGRYEHVLMEYDVSELAGLDAGRCHVQITCHWPPFLAFCLGMASYVQDRLLACSHP